jgi:hypothetical protein
MSVDVMAKSSENSVMFYKIFYYLYFAGLIYLTVDGSIIAIKINSWEYFASLFLNITLCFYWIFWQKFSTNNIFLFSCITITIIFSTLRGGVQMNDYFGSEIKFYFFSVSFYLILMLPFYIKTYMQFKIRE